MALSCELANDGRAGRAHISGNLGDGKRPAIEIADRYAQADEAVSRRTPKGSLAGT
jgi:hypothetical protein